jgi:Bacterial transcriptional activator domain
VSVLIVLVCAGLLVVVWRQRSAMLGPRRAPTTSMLDDWPDPRDDPMVQSQELRVVAASSELDRLGACLEGLAQTLRGDQIDIALLGLHIGPTVAEVLWSGLPPVPAAPWRDAPSGWVWQARMVELFAVAERQASGSKLLPALVRFGATRLGVLYLNLEAFGLVTLAGDVEDRAACLGLLLGGLEEAVRSGGCEGFVVDPSEGTVAQAGDTDGLVRPLEEVLRAIHRRARAVSQGLAGSGVVSAFEARANGGNPDRFRPLVAVADSVLPEGRVDRLVEVCRRSSAVTCVLAGDHAGSDLVLECRDGQVWLPFLSNVGVTLRVTSEAEASDHSAVELRAADQTVAVDDVGSSPESAFDEVLASTVTETPLPVIAIPDAAVTVRVLGRVEVEGGTKPLVGKSLELIVYLACHPGGVSVDRLKAALWPERVPRPQTWMNRVSSCRQLLGTGGDGELLLPHFEGQIARLSPLVRNDVALIEAALGQSGADPASAITVLREALALVRGRPFDAPTGYEWAYGELHVAHAERVVVDAAHRLAALALGVGEWRVALWASEQGLSVASCDESLYQDRMRALHAGGDMRAVDAAMRDLLAAVGADAPDGVLHSDTVELYEQLRAQPPPAHPRQSPDESG